MTQQVAYYPLIGGEDLVTPPTQVKPGRILFSKNYEPDEAGGYRRIDGYERFDGRVKPSDASYVTYAFDAGSNEPSLNDAVSGGTSGATGRVAGYTLTSGSWVGNDAVGKIAIHNISGTFVDDDVLTNTTASNTLSTLDGVSLGQSAPTDTLYDTWLQTVIEWRRDQIAAVPGVDSVLGVWQYEGDKYAFRNVSGGASAKMFKSTTSGWTEVSLGQQLAFTAGGAGPGNAVPPEVGATITGATSGATGVVTGYNVTGGAFADTDAVGFIYFHTLSGTFQSTEQVDYGSGAAAGNVTAGGASTAITLPAGGRYEFVNFNFYGQASGNTMYGVNGVGYAFSYDGNGLAFINYLGSSTAVYPNHIAAHKFHLFLSYGSSAFNSGVAKPYSIAAGDGGAETATGDTITALRSLPGDVLAIFSRNSTRLLYGTSSGDWNLKDHSLNSGARPWTVQFLGTARYLDDRGLTQLNAVDAFGDFKENTFSQMIDPYMKTRLGDEQASMIVREKDQYRLFFSDGTGLICRVDEGNRFPQFTRIEYPDKVVCCTSGENSSGTEELFFGSDDGFVYQMDKGTSCDGAALEYILRLPFNNLKSPRSKKRFFKAIFEIEALGGVTLEFTPDFSYGSSFTPKGRTQTLNVQSGAAYWGEGIEWGSFTWGAETPGNAEAYILGSGQNLGLLLRGSAIYEDSHTITSVLVHYKVRGLKR